VTAILTTTRSVRRASGFVKTQPTRARGSVRARCDAHFGNSVM